MARIFDQIWRRGALWLATRLLSRRRKNGTHRQMAVLTGDTIGDAIFLNGFYERNELEALLAWIRNFHADTLGKTAVDVGANIGNHAVFFGKYFPKVIAYEPNKKLHPLLSFNTASIHSVEIRDVGLSDRAMTSNLTIPYGNTGAANIIESQTGVEVCLERLDDQGISAEAIGIIKVDVEGHELKVLKGGIETIRRGQPVIVFEQHQSEVEDGSSPTLEWLRDQGYHHFYGVGRPRHRFLGFLRSPQVYSLKELSDQNYPMIIAVHQDRMRNLA